MITNPLRALIRSLLLIPVVIAFWTPAYGQEPDPTEPADPTASGLSEGFAAYPTREPMLVTVTPGARALDPVAVPMPGCTTDKAICETVQTVLARDLTLSGFFSVLGADSYIAEMDRETLAQTKWEDWFNVGAKYLIKAQIEGSGKGKYSISYRLYDVNLRKNIEVNRQEASVSAGRVRSVTHRFVNEVIRAITGMPGPFGGRILFAQKTGNSTKAVYAIDVDGYGRSKLSKEGSIFMLPSQSGKNVLYTGFEDDGPALFLNGKRISPEGKACRGGRLSPGGKHIAVSMDEGGQSDIFLMTLEGEVLENLTNHWADEVSPVWSPDGSMISFVSNRTGAPQIYIMNKDGSGPRRITYAGGYNSTPSFGPGGMMAFSGMDDFQYDIFLVDMSGTITRLTQDQGNNRDPAISPDGRHIAFISDREGSPKIFISTIEGRYQFPITEKGGNFSTLFWVR